MKIREISSSIKPKKKFPLQKYLLVGLIFTIFITTPIAQIFGTIIDESSTLEPVEVTEYEGQDLSSINDFFENSIKGPQYIEPENYSLIVTGMVNNTMLFSYEDIINNFPQFKKVVTLDCVEGWSVTILWEGIMVKDLISEIGVNPNATTVIFYAYDGYSTSLPLDYILDKNILMAYKMNNVTLPPKRGFPFQLVAESKWGYKWIKWITGIALSDNEEYKGYWELRGYNNDGDLGQGYWNPDIPEFPSWFVLPLFLAAPVVVLLYKKRIRNG